MSEYFIVAFSLVKSFSLPFAKEILLCLRQWCFESSQWGPNMRRPIPEKTIVTPRSRAADAKEDYFIFLASASN